MAPFILHPSPLNHHHKHPTLNTQHSNKHSNTQHLASNSQNAVDVSGFSLP
eukprot:gnl/Chilomastix_caulleri/7579.p2 GENE.gnl/Chilomastix_caulleri/7579~~gnl/Chilomastix_caulleri/7579.p2  ORF type:complete len:51 (+),score=12.60 gnl/Chilomastix_caulleri/7579:29-181(+)